jgi:hypothetical protein
MGIHWIERSNSGPDVQSSWIKEAVDISEFAGSRSGCALNTSPMRCLRRRILVDDISIPEIDYSSDFENDDSGWQADGFVPD